MKRWVLETVTVGLLAGFLGGAPTWGRAQTGTADPADMSAPKGMDAPAATKTDGMEDKTPAAAKVNINTADQAGLMTLKGIGEKRAKAIIAYREKNGPFKAADDLGNVKGVGKKTAARLKDHVTVE